ncbi:molybdopterin molybdotransferase MoeA [Rhodovulum sp. DZ06]|uniref:molybdopterin molybdotransferase MoeA n=1 Tax=Rhodovulum sp. DZ06 TaxID=3425126 RepID=UPI003D34F504
MLPVPEALARVLSLVEVLGEEDVPLTEAAGRVLARPVHALRTQPPFAASAMDGYAVKGAELRPGAVFTVVAESRAGEGAGRALGPGEAIRIFTGAPVPEGADHVVIQEDVRRERDRITVLPTLGAGPNIRPAGLDFEEGQALPVRRLRPADIALLAAFNHASVPVRRKPVVALVATGDELVEPGQAPGPDQIVSSNSYGLHAMLRAHGADPRLLPIARDSRAALTEALEASRGADLVVTLGGASVGDHDLVAEVFGEGGLDLSFYKIAMRPGKPLMAGRIKDGPMMVGLPGNPVSAMVCGHLFLRPALDAFAGLPAGPLPRARAPLAAAVPATAGREHYARAALEDGPDGPRLRVFNRQDSSVLSLLADADALAVFPAGAPAMAAGEMAEYIRL